MNRYVTLLLLSMVSNVFAEEGVPEALAQTTIEPGATDHLLKVTLGLGVIVALIFLVAWVVKRMGYMQFGGNNQFKVVSSLAVGQRERLLVIAIGDEQIMVGVSAGRINKIHELKEHIDTANKAPTTTHFANKLKQAINKRTSS